MEGVGGVPGRPTRTEPRWTNRIEEDEQVGHLETLPINLNLPRQDPGGTPGQTDD